MKEINAAGYHTNVGDDWLKFAAFKLTLDGGMTIGTAFQRHPYGPFGKQLYSSDAYGLPELHYLGSVLWRRAMGEVLGGWVRRGDWSQGDGGRVVDIVAHAAVRAHQPFIDVRQDGARGPARVWTTRGLVSPQSSGC